eukprot:CAMPEP_0171533014 /NCGR_PEP_ID=MMETSP0959-20130129/15335_1 /TAXON_ID=87120 /ORGANISM="Aurantiochytrium limacinum, Strain ATCCMYA-1381" /LENGTH=41 /DNA_ID= /DNA_START= /DNA_END= /DNA_ORIENTATION=
MSLEVYWSSNLLQGSASNSLETHGKHACLAQYALYTGDPNP